MVLCGRYSSVKEMKLWKNFIKFHRDTDSVTDQYLLLSMINPLVMENSERKMD